MSPLLAQTGRAGQRQPRQLSGGKRTSRFDSSAAANDPKQTLIWSGNPLRVPRVERGAVAGGPVLRDSCRIASFEHRGRLVDVERRTAHSGVCLQVRLIF